MSKPRFALFLIVLSMCGGVTRHARAIGLRHDIPNVTSTGLDNPYVFYGAGFDAVVNLTWTTHRGSFQASGTLAQSVVPGEYKILTAAHVVDGKSGANFPDGIVDATSYSIEFGDNSSSITHQVSVPKANVSVQPRWATGDPAGTGLSRGAAQFDMAVLSFDASDLVFGDVSSLPTAYTVWGGDAEGELATMVGFGQWGLGDDFYAPNGSTIYAKDGTRRAGTNVIDAIDSQSAEDNDGYTARSDFDAVTFGENRSVAGYNGTVQPLEASTAAGDSGGPLLVGGSQDLITGVLHGGYNHFAGADDSEYGDVGVWASVSEPINQQFLQLNGLAFYGYGVASSPANIATVPEPSGQFLSYLAAFFLTALRRRRHVA